MKIKYHFQATRAYFAGILTAKAHNIFYSQKNLPSVIQCLKDFPHLQVVLGKYYQKLKRSKDTRDLVIIYERFAYQPGRPIGMRGTLEDFLMGYAYARKKKPLTSEDRANLKLLGLIPE